VSLEAEARVVRVTGSRGLPNDGLAVSLQDVVDVARGGAHVELASEATTRMEASLDHVRRAASSDRPVYGVSTGFGALATTRIPLERRVDLQHAIIRSHAAGIGPELPREVVRAMIFMRVRTLALGYSGVRPVLAQRLAALLNANLTPFVPTYGSLGASGDLAPLAHVALALIGEGEVITGKGQRVQAATALKDAGIEPVQLETKEGLALVNGTDGMLGMLCLACHDADLLFKTAEVAAAMSIEALLGTDRPFAQAVNALRPHPGQMVSASNLMRLMADSPITASHRNSDHAVQDSYSMRCSPQVVGAARDALSFAVGIASCELSSVTDNPVVLSTGEVESTGNFHGEPVAFACDFLAIGASEVGAIAERRVDRLLDSSRSAGLPAFLAAEPGVDSGLMVAGYTAAALVAENRRLAVPASIDSIPTSGMQEDHVSMGWGAALKLRQSLVNLAGILAVEILAASRALDLRAPLQPGPATTAVRDLVRVRVSGPGPDRPPAPELAWLEEQIRSGRIVAAAEAVIGQLA
jgi:histidine ammonia-lyase